MLAIIFSPFQTSTNLKKNKSIQLLLTWYLDQGRVSHPMWSVLSGALGRGTTLSSSFWSPPVQCPVLESRTGSVLSLLSPQCLRQCLAHSSTERIKEGIKKSLTAQWLDLCLTVYSFVSYYNENTPRTGSTEV